MKAYRFEILLKDSHPPVWRRVEVPVSMTFSGFSNVIQKLFGFDGSHLSEFEFPELELRLSEDGDEPGWYEERRMDEYRIGELECCRKFKYTYDFGDDWRFQIQRETILDDYGHDYPQVVKAKGLNLVEDIGGVYFYSLFLEDQKKPVGEREMEFGDIKESDLAFDIDKVNNTLKNYICPDMPVKPLTEDELTENELMEDELYEGDFDPAEFIRNLGIDEEELQNNLNEVFDLMDELQMADQIASRGECPKNEKELNAYSKLVAYSTICNMIENICEEWDISEMELLAGLSLTTAEKTIILEMLNNPDDDDDQPMGEPQA